MIGLVEQIKHTTQLRWNKVYQFKAKINFQLEMGPYLIKTADSTEELIECFQLRHEVFNKEFRGLTRQGMDFDRYDYFFDHLTIIHKPTQKIIGTYRLNCSKFSTESYTALEFELSALRFQIGHYLELGRACIQKEFRKGSVISLLWRGIAEYMNLSEASILFGCSSLKINTARDAALVYKRLLDQNLITHNYLCKPTKDFTMHNFDKWHAEFSKGLSEEQQQEAESLIPSLLKSYIKLGAKVACEPAFDKDFDCIDMLTVLRKEDLSDFLTQKFQVY